jgi:hypothetical protein
VWSTVLIPLPTILQPTRQFYRVFEDFRHAKPAKAIQDLAKALLGIQFGALWQPLTTRIK